MAETRSIQVVRMSPGTRLLQLTLKANLMGSEIMVERKPHIHILLLPYSQTARPPLSYLEMGCPVTFAIIARITSHYVSNNIVCELLSLFI